MSIRREIVKPLLIVLTVCLLGFSTTYLLLRGVFASWDGAAFRTINNLGIDCLWLDVTLLFLGGIGGGYLAPLLIVAFAIFSRNKYGRESTLLLAISWLLSLAATSFLKPLFACPRPYHILSDVRTHILQYFLGARALPRSYTFPSSHTTEAFSTCWTIGPRYKKWFAPLIGLAFTVAFSMIYFGFHFPSDSLAGGFLGTAIGYTTNQLGNLRNRTKMPTVT